VRQLAAALDCASLLARALPDADKREVLDECLGEGQTFESLPQLQRHVGAVAYVGDPSC